MLDLHTHLYWKDFDTDREEVIARALRSGITRMISVGTDIETSQKAIGIAEEHKNVFASVGIHPHEFNETEILHLESWREELRELAKHSKVVAIGECGLDYFGRNTEVSDDMKTRQKAAFLMQLELAKELGLPLIIHTRPSVGSMNAYEDVLAILKETCHSERSEASRDDLPGDTKNGVPRQVWNNRKCILHCYQGSTEVTKKFLELPNAFFSFAGNITYPVKKHLVGTKDDLQETVKLVPLDRLFTETDCPFLTPQKKRGERNEPGFVRYVAEKIAEIHGVSVDEITGQVNRNFKRVFEV